MPRRKYRWWHGVLFYAGVQAASFALRALTRAPKEDRQFYASTKLPVFAPPGIAFPIAWGINNLSTMAGGLYVLNLPEPTPGRQRFLRSQAVAWLLFSSFNAAYFGLRSPINAAVITCAYSAATGISLHAATRVLQDRRAAWSLVTTVAWLGIANPLGITQALWNHDPFWNAGPFVTPLQKWVKQQRAVLPESTKSYSIDSKP